MRLKLFFRRGWGVLLMGLLTMLLTAAALVAYRVGGPAHALRMFASAGFILTGIAAGGLRSRFGIAMTFGLAFGWLGDYALMQSGSNWFLAGLVFFLFGHLGYSAAQLMAGVKVRLASTSFPFILAPAVILALSVWSEVPETLHLRFWCVLYSFILVGMTALTVGRWGRPGGNLAAIGAVAFYASDICVALRTFGSSGKGIAVAGLMLYYGGQVMLASSILYSEPQAPDVSAEASLRKG
jgi:uncharacterized membrane protein YhhN